MLIPRFGIHARARPRLQGWHRFQFRNLISDARSECPQDKNHHRSWWGGRFEPARFQSGLIKFISLIGINIWTICSRLVPLPEPRRAPLRGRKKPPNKIPKNYLFNLRSSVRGLLRFRFSRFLPLPWSTSSLCPLGGWVAREISISQVESGRQWTRVYRVPVNRRTASGSWDILMAKLQ